MIIASLQELNELTLDGLILDRATVSVAPGEVRVSCAAEVLGASATIVATIRPVNGTTLASELTVTTEVTTLRALSTRGWLGPDVDPATLPSPDAPLPGLVLTPDPEYSRVLATTAIPASRLAGLPLPLVAPSLRLTLFPDAGGGLGAAYATIDAWLPTGGPAPAPATVPPIAPAGQDTDSTDEGGDDLPVPVSPDGSAGLPVVLELPRAGGDWRIAGQSLVGGALGDLAAGLRLVAADLGTNLPVGLPGGFALTRLDAGVSAPGGRLRSTTVELATTGSWTVLTGVLTLDALRLTVVAEEVAGDGDLTPAWALTGELAGAVTLFGVAIGARIPLTGGPVLLVAHPGVEVPGLVGLVDSLADLLGTTALSPALPPSIAEIGAFVVDEVAVVIDPLAPELSEVSVRLSVPDGTTWTFPFLPGLVLDGLTVGLTVLRPLDPAHRSIGGDGVVEATIGATDLDLTVVRTPGADLCTVTLGATSPIGLSDVLTLVGLDGEAFASALPPALSIVSELGLSELDVEYDLASERAQRTTAIIELDDAWRLIPDALEISALSVEITVAVDEADSETAPSTEPPAPSTEPPAPATTSTTELRVDGTLLIGETMLVAQAERTAGDWVLDLKLAAGTPVSISDLLWAIAPAVGLTMPSGFPEITLTAAEVRMAPATLATTASLAAAASWGPTFGGTTGSMANLSMLLDVPAQTGGTESGGGTRDATLVVAGSLTLAPLPTLTAVARLGPDETELLAVLTSEDAAEAPPESVADGFAGTGTWDGIPVPAGFVPPGLTGGGVYLNLATETLLVFGQATRLGQAALLVTRQPASDDDPAGTEPGFGVAFVLDVGPGFRFADLIPGTGPSEGPVGLARAALATIDAFIRLEQVTLSLASAPVTATTGTGSEPDPAAAVDRMRAVAAGLPTPVIVPALSAASALRGRERGLSVDGQLVLTGPVWDMLSYVIETRAGLAIAVHATIDPVDPSATVFLASLGPFVVLRTITFSSVELRYVARDGESVRLTCAGSVSVPGTATAGSAGGTGSTGDELVRFAGDLTVTSTTAAGRLAMVSADPLRHPLGVPGIELRSVLLDVAWSTAPPSDTGTTGGTGTPPATTTRRLDRFNLVGEVVIGSVADLVGTVEFRDGTPRLVRVDLAGSIGLGELLAQCVGAGDWSATGLPDIVLRGGSLRYVPDDVPAGPAGPELEAGFRLSSGIRLFGVDFDLAAEITEDGGVVGTAGLSHALDLGFIALTGPTDPAKGPLVSLQVLRGAKTFGVGFGFDLFGLRFSRGALRYSPASSSATSGSASGSQTERYTGTITYDGEDTPLGASFTLSVEWTEASGFRVTDWPAIPDIPAIDLVRLIQSVGAGDACGALGALGIGPDIVTGECRTNLRLTPEPTTSAPFAIRLEADVYYDVFVKVPTGDRLLLNPGSSPLPFSMVIEAPESTRASDIALMIGETLLAGIDGIVSAIVDDPEALLQLTSAIALQHLANKAIGALLCRGTDSPPLRDEYSRRTRSNDPADPNGGEEELAKAAEKAAEAAEAATAEGAAIAAEAVIVATAAAVTFFGALLSSLLSIFGAESDEERDARRKRDRANALKAQALAAVREKLAVDEVTIRATGPDTARVEWTAVAGDQVTYRPVVTVSDADGSNPTRLALSELEELGLPDERRETHLNLAGTPIAPGKRVTVAVTASIPRPNSSDRYTGTATTSSHVMPSYTPSDLVVEQVHSTLHVSWRTGPTLPGGWTVTAEPEGATETVVIVGAADDDGIPDGDGGRVAGVTLTDGLVPDVPITVTLAPTGTEYPVPSISTTISMLDGGPPESLWHRFDVVSQELTFEWTDSGWVASSGFVVELYPGADDGTADYAVSRAAALGRVAVRDREYQKIAVFGDPSFVPGLPLRARVASAGSEGRMVWSELLPITLATLAPPAITELTFNGEVIAASCATVPGASDYQAHLLDATGAPLDPPAETWVDWAPPEGGEGSESGMPWTPVLKLRTAFSDGQRLGVRLRAIGESCSGPWSELGPPEVGTGSGSGGSGWITVRILPKVTGITPTDVPSAVLVRWDECAVPFDYYRVTAYTEWSAPLDPPGEIRIPSGVSDDDRAARLTDLGGGAYYRVAVEVVADGIVGPSEYPVLFYRATHTAPVISSIGYDSGYLRVEWSASDPNGPFYEVAWSTPSGPLEPRVVGGTEALVELPGSLETDGEYSVRVRAVPDVDGDGVSPGPLARSRPGSEPWSEPAVLRRLAGPPVLTSVTCAGQVLMAEWEPIEGVCAYRVEMAGGPQPRPGETRSWLTTSTTFESTVARPISPLEYTIRVRAEEPAGVAVAGPWTEATAPIPGPARVLRFSEDTWAEVTYRDRGYQNPGVPVPGTSSPDPNPNTLYNLVNDGLTVEAEIFVPDASDSSGLVGRRPVLQIAHDAGTRWRSDGPAFLLYLDDGRPASTVTCYTWDSGTPSAPSASTITGAEAIETGRWVHLAVTMTYGGHRVLYVNGSEVARGWSSASMPGFTNYRIGRSDADEPFAGYLRQVRVWKGPHTAADIAATAGQDLTPDVPTHTARGLGGYWPLTDSHGPQAEDLTTKNPATIHNPRWEPQV